MNKYACVRTDNMSGTIEGKNLVSLKYSEDIENGNVLVIGGYEAGEREVRTASKPQKNTALRDLALVATPEVVKEKNYNALDEFINKKGALIRGYRLTPKDYFSITEEALEAGSQKTVGTIVEVVADSTKLKGVASATEGTTTVGKIVAVEGKWYVIEVVDPE